MAAEVSDDTLNQHSTWPWNSNHKGDDDMPNSARTHTPTKFPSFPTYPCPSDRVQTTYGPFTIKAVLVYDNDTSPKDFEGYTPEDFDAWLRDDWCYVGVVLSLWRGNVCFDDSIASVWGIELGLRGTDERKYVNEAANDMLPVAIKRTHEVWDDLRKWVCELPEKETT